MTQHEMDAIAERLSKIGLVAKDLPQHKGKPRASVLVPLFRRATGWQVLLTRRSSSLRTHSGEVCFPGGRQDPEDQMNDIQTALREANEEVGLHPEHVRPICRLETEESVNGLCVTPVVGIIDPPGRAEPKCLSLSPHEVDTAFYMPLAYFLAEENHVSKEPLQWSGGTFIMRVFMYTAECGNDFKVWGLTAHIAHRVAELAILQRVPRKTPSHPSQLQEGYLYLLQDEGDRTEHWVRKYFVLEKRILHYFGSQGQANRKSNAATKKNRVNILNAVILPKANRDGRFPFKIIAADGKIQWFLAAESGEIRSTWMYVLNAES